MSAAVDIPGELARLEQRHADALAAHRADLDDGYLKLQYRAASEELVRFRQFWRGVDATVDMGNPDYGIFHRGVGGRRGGEFIHLDETPEA